MSQDTEIYTLSTPDIFDFCIDDLLDFSNDELFSSSTSTTTDTDIHLPLQISTPTTTPNFSHDFYIPDDDVAELEWLSNFVEESLSSFPRTNFTTVTASSTAATTNNISLVPAKARSKRPKSTKTHDSQTSAATRMRKCSHCASEKTPQWRTGPLGPKTLCNACGVRYKSGRLVPEYRPAASPTFVLTQHSNSHRKVMELRRQKEDRCHVLYHHRRDYRVC